MATIVAVIIIIITKIIFIFVVIIVTTNKITITVIICINIILLQLALNKPNFSKVFMLCYMRGDSSTGREFNNRGDDFFACYYGLYHKNISRDDPYFKNFTRRYFLNGICSNMSTAVSN